MGDPTLVTQIVTTGTASVSVIGSDGSGKSKVMTAAEVRTAGGLGTAAVAATGDFATAAQGALANSALQSGTAISTVSGLQTALDTKQATLVSATNIKTVNGTSILGSGDLTVSGGGTSLRPNRYYSAYQSQQLSTVVMVPNTLYFLPLSIPASFSATRIGINVTTAVSGNARLGIYSDVSGVPSGSPLLDAGTVSLGTTGEKEITISQSLAAGNYWLAIVTSSAATLTSEQLGTSGIAIPNLGSASSTSNIITHLTQQHTYAALPSVSNLAVRFGKTLPRVYVRSYTAGSEDVYLSLVSLLLKCNGTNGDTAFIDSSPNEYAVTAVGTARISTAQSKFGGSSLLLDGGSDYLSLARQSPLEIGTGDFTIEAWVRPTSYPIGSSPQFNSLIYSTRGSSSIAGLICVMKPNGKLALFVSSNSSSWDVFSGTEFTTTAIPLNTWTHIAITRSGNSWKGFFNGTNEATTTNAGNPSTGSGNIFIGGDVAGERFYGYMDDVRVTKGLARYTASFTAPAAGFVGTEWVA